MSGGTNRAAFASRAPSSGFSDALEKQVKAELEKAMAGSALRREFDLMRQQHELLRQELQAYRSAAPPAQRIGAGLPGVDDKESPAFQRQKTPAFQKLQSSPAFHRLVSMTKDHHQERRVKEQKDFADLLTALQEWRVKAGLSSAAVDLLALQASKIAEAEREAVMNTLGNEEKNLTTGPRRSPSPDAEYQPAFSDSDGSHGSARVSFDKETQLSLLMEKQIKTLDMVQKQLEGTFQGITEQQLQRLEESCKSHIDKAFRAGALGVEQFQSQTMPLPEPTSEPTAQFTTDAAEESINKDEKQEAAGCLHLANTTRPPTHEEFMTIKVAKETKAEIDLMVNSTMWEISQIEKPETSHSWYTLAFERATTKKSGLHDGIKQLGLDFLIPHTRPSNVLVHIVDTTLFHALTVLAIVVNTAFSGLQADQSVQALMKNPPERLPSWWGSVDLGFTIYFGFEVVLRLLAFRGFFFVEKGHALWNILDLVVCMISVAATNFDIVFLRLLRIIRLARLLKVIAQAKALALLRNLLFAVVACLVPLFWAVAFLIITMLMFGLLILQCISSSMQTLEEDLSLRDEVRMYFYGFQGCLKTLAIAVMGPDWVDPHDTLSSLGVFSALVMPLFIVFVNIGVMNVVIGVFAEEQSGSKDRHSIADAEIDDVTTFSAEMVELVSEAVDKNGNVEWDQFKEFFYNEDVQAFLHYHGLDSSHVQLLYHLLDNSGDNVVDIRDFVIGMLRLKGEAKRLDQQVELHALNTLVKDVQLIRHDLKKMSGQSQHAHQ